MLNIGFGNYGRFKPFVRAALALCDPESRIFDIGGSYIMILSVCVGSSCHLKGSYDVIEAFKALIEKHNVADKIELRACFCLNRCSDGVAVKAGDTYILNVGPANAEEKFVNEVLPLISK